MKQNNGTSKSQQTKLYKNPESFLNRLGIRSSENGKYSARCDTAFGALEREWGRDSLSTMGMNPSYADEQKAGETPGGLFDRLSKSMELLSNSTVFRDGKLDSICQLRGGTGLLGMWLSAQGLCDSCQIADPAGIPIAYGSKWAGELSLANIRFLQASYTEIASAGSHDFDFAFTEAGIDLHYFPADAGFPGVDRSKTDAFFLERYKQLAAAMHSQLRPNGVALIADRHPSLASLTLLCRALRAKHLAIDWRITYNRDRLQLYVRPDGPIVIDSPEDEALALLADAVPAEHIDISRLYSFETMFRRGKKYFELCSKVDGVTYTTSIFQCAGLACVFQRSSAGHFSARLVSAARMHLGAVQVLLMAKPHTITSKFIDDRLNALVNDTRFFGLTPPPSDGDSRTASDWKDPMLDAEEESASAGLDLHIASLKTEKQPENKPSPRGGGKKGKYRRQNKKCRNDILASGPALSTQQEGVNVTK